jgi:hypothetical protein
MTKLTNVSPKTATASNAAGEPASLAGPAKVPAPATADVSPPPLPKTWSEIQVGSLVIGHEGHADGWWEAVVTEVRGDVLTLRWRDYPHQRAVTRDRQDVALLFPGD